MLALERITAGGTGPGLAGDLAIVWRRVGVLRVVVVLGFGRQVVEPVEERFVDHAADPQRLAHGIAVPLDQTHDLGAPALALGHALVRLDVPDVNLLGGLLMGDGDAELLDCRRG